MKESNKKSVFKTLQSVGRVGLAALFLLAGVGIALLTIYVSHHFIDSKPILTFRPDVPQQRVVGMMDAFCNGNFSEASGFALDNPNIGAEHQAADEISTIIWQAFIDNTDYSLSGNCYTTDDGLSQNITFTCLDISSVTASLRDRSQELLKQRVEAAEDVSEIYDANNEYREDVVNAVLKEAVLAALNEDSELITTTVAIDLRYENGQWWTVIDQDLLDVLFGDVLFYQT